MDRDLTTIVSPDVAHDLSVAVQHTTQAPPVCPLRGSVLVLIQ